MKRRYSERARSEGEGEGNRVRVDEMLLRHDVKPGLFTHAQAVEFNLEGKTVLFVGGRSSALAIAAADAGAGRVFHHAKDAESAVQAQDLIFQCGVQDTVAVLTGSMEEVRLEEEVDIIISEFLGEFLLRESALDTLVLARDKLLKAGGVVYPSSAKMFLAPVTYADAKVHIPSNVTNAVDVDRFWQSLAMDLLQERLRTSDDALAEASHLLGAPCASRK